MNTVYDPNKLSKIEPDEDGDSFASMDDFLEKREDGLFHVGQSYEDVPAKTLYCKFCGGNEFYIGQGNYFTAAKCIKCDYEIGIHNG